MAGYVQVIKISRKDIPDVLVLLKKILGDIDDAATLNILNSRMESPYFLYLYARLDGEPVGIVEVQFRKEILLSGPREYGYLPMLYVMPEARRKGVASRLLQVAQIWLKNNGAKEMWAMSGPQQEGLNPFLGKSGLVPNQAKFVKDLTQ